MEDLMYRGARLFGRRIYQSCSFKGVCPRIRARHRPQLPQPPTPQSSLTMAAQAWKSRAESMLSQFITGDEAIDAKSYSVLNGHISTFLKDNSSTSDNHSTCSYGVYDRLLGCECAGSGSDHVVGNGPCVSVVLAWVKFVLGRVMRIYLSNPLLLAFVPLLLGVGFGIWIGRRSVCQENPGGINKRSKSWLWGREMLLSLCLNCSTHVLYSLRRGGFVNESKLFDDQRDEQTRLELRANESTRESGVDLECVPGHIAVIMDGNRRYGKSKYGNATRGHWDGSKTLIEFTKWCIAEGVQALTVYAFSTENWDRDPSEVSALMSIFCKYCEELRVEALQRGIRIHVLSTDDARIPSDVREGIHRMVSQTKHCDKFTINICLSYGSRGEIVNACKSITQDVIDGLININQIEAKVLQEKMLTKHCCDPDIIIRTSGEERLSNFLLWQSAYSELFFLKKPWPELEKEDLIEVIRGFAQGRKRRYGK
jgi:undecaprenyl diphosphate synthase